MIAIWGALAVLSLLTLLSLVLAAVSYCAATQAARHAAETASPRAQAVL